MQADYGAQTGGETTPEGFAARVKSLLDIGVEDFASAVVRLSQASTDINKVFTQGRQRVIELQQAVADSVPDVLRLGGSIQDVTNSIEGVAKAANRNVVATQEQIEKLYAANKILGESAESLTNNFMNVGMSVKDIGKNLEASIQYVQSIGGNAAEVVKDMTANMDQLNRYQFEGGVKGLTKMAAQASMLRFDMNQTFQLAEKVLSPEGAIQVASAFQRLGVSVGNLVDPFQLMNQSINDPSGLQDSLAQMTKQFSYFDEETKTFKINPQGVLTINEIANQTQMSAKELREMSLAALELDRRLSAVSAAGLSVASEEDKQYLANIATMTKEGTYEVKIKDEKSGEYITKELSQVTQTEFDKLIKEQKEGPKTLEDLARSQMNITESIEADVSAIRAKLVGGVASTSPVLRGFEGARNLVSTIGGEVSDIGGTKEVRKKVQDFMKGMGSIVEELADPNTNKLSVIQKYMASFGTELDDIKNDLNKAIKNALEKSKNKLNTDNKVEAAGSWVLGKVLGQETTNTKASKQAEILNDASKKAESLAKEGKIPYGTQVNSKVEFGVLKVDLNIQGNQTLNEPQKQEIVKILTEKFRELGVQNYMVQVNQKNPSTASGIAKAK